MIRPIAVSAIPAALLVCTPAPAEKFVTGRVTDTDGAPVAGASIQFFEEENPRNVFGDTTAGDGSYSVVLSLPTSIEAGAIPVGFQLFPNYPNPFNSSTLIPYSLAEPGHVELAVYNLLGHRVAPWRTRTCPQERRLPPGTAAATMAAGSPRGCTCIACSQEARRPQGR